MPTSVRPKLILTLLAALGPGARADPRDALARHGCAALASAVARHGDGPQLLASFPAVAGEPPLVAHLQNVAFTYDNALASIALYACGKPAAARRIADALMLAATSDPEFADGRVRNAYAAGQCAATGPELSGYWSAERQQWIQDAYQLSSSTGNVAWAALALLHAHARTREVAFLDAARQALDWTRITTFDGRLPAGYNGGIYLAPTGPLRQTWKSTEHHVDLAAAWTWLDRMSPSVEARTQAILATGFVWSQWDRADGRFYIGTGSDGLRSDREHSALDAQVWPLIALDPAPADWLRVLDFVEAEHRVAGGFGFNGRPDGVWTEGTAQMAAVYMLRGRPRRAAELWPLLHGQATAEGWLYATPEARITTGLAIGPESTGSDFHYDHLPHLGATAWAVIAALGINPFVAGPAHDHRSDAGPVVEAATSSDD